MATAPAFTAEASLNRPGEPRLAINRFHQRGAAGVNENLPTGSQSGIVHPAGLVECSPCQCSFYCSKDRPDICGYSCIKICQVYGSTYIFDCTPWRWW